MRSYIIWLVGLCIYYLGCKSVFFGSRLLLRVKIGSSNWQVEIEMPCKEASVEIGSACWLINHTNWPLLLEQQQDVTVNSNRRSGPRVWHNLPSYSIVRQLEVIRHSSS